ncbi:hypothetical protein DJICPGNB_25935 [Escherichia coli]|nr:hypothetical protein DJICPGNB_25935 [Escherichia coli]
MKLPCRRCLLFGRGDFDSDNDILVGLQRSPQCSHIYHQMLYRSEMDGGITNELIMNLESLSILTHLNASVMSLTPYCWYAELICWLWHSHSFSLTKITQVTWRYIRHFNFDIALSATTHMEGVCKL